MSIPGSERLRHSGAFRPDIRVPLRGLRGVVAGLALIGVLAACEGCGPKPPDGPQWEAVLEELPGAILSLWGTSTNDFYGVGGNALMGRGPMAVHFDGTAWTFLPTGFGNGQVLWWVYGFAGGTAYMVGTQGVILPYDLTTGSFGAAEATPGLQTLFGTWGCSPTDLWAVGGAAAGLDMQVLWHSDGSGTWTDTPLPASVSGAALFKVWGSACDDVWAVGSEGLAAHYDGVDWADAAIPEPETFFTVHTDGPRVVAVGGFANGLVAEWDGTAWSVQMPSLVPRLNGVYLTADRDWIAGERGLVMSRPGGAASVGVAFVAEQSVVTDRDYHVVWVAPEGDVWAAGGEIVSSLTDGVVAHLGDPAVGPGTVSGL